MFPSPQAGISLKGAEELNKVYHVSKEFPSPQAGISLKVQCKDPLSVNVIKVSVPSGGDKSQSNNKQYPKTITIIWEFPSPQAGISLKVTLLEMML